MMGDLGSTEFIKYLTDNIVRDLDILLDSKAISPDNHASIISKLSYTDASPRKQGSYSLNCMDENVKKNQNDLGAIFKGAKAAYDLDSNTKMFSRTQSLRGKFSKDKTSSKSPEGQEFKPVPPPRVSEIAAKSMDVEKGRDKPTLPPKRLSQSSVDMPPSLKSISDTFNRGIGRAGSINNTASSEKPTPIPPPRPALKNGLDFRTSTADPPQLPAKPKTNKAFFSTEPLSSTTERKPVNSSTFSPPPLPPRN